MPSSATTTVPVPAVTSQETTTWLARACLRTFVSASRAASRELGAVDGAVDLAEHEPDLVRDERLLVLDDAAQPLHERALAGRGALDIGAQLGRGTCRDAHELAGVDVVGVAAGGDVLELLQERVVQPCPDTRPLGIECLGDACTRGMRAATSG